MSLILTGIEIASATGAVGYGAYNGKKTVHYIKNKIQERKDAKNDKEIIESAKKLPPAEWNAYLSDTTRASATLKLMRYNITCPETITLKNPLHKFPFNNQYCQGFLVWNQSRNVYLFKNTDPTSLLSPMAIGQSAGMSKKTTIDDYCRQTHDFNEEHNTLYLAESGAELHRITPSTVYTINNQQHHIALFRDDQNMLWISHFSTMNLDGGQISDHIALPLIDIAGYDMTPEF